MNKAIKNLISCCVIFLLMTACSATTSETEADEWISLFDGKTLTGWKASENPATFKIEEGNIVAHGPRAHLFYVGPVMNHDFKNFELKAQVMTTPGSNSGIFFHTEYQESGWPAKGYEVQVNNTQSDWRRTGSLYAFQDVKDTLVKDNVWFTQHIIVKDKNVVVKINGEKVVDYTEPENVKRPADDKDKVFSSGTFALQGHDPDSKVYYKEIMVKPLPE